MTPAEWIKRCADRYMQRGVLSETDAAISAQICFEETDDPLSERPEQCADDDMDCWEQ